MKFLKTKKLTGSFTCKDCGTQVETGYTLYSSKEYLAKIKSGEVSDVRCQKCFADGLAKDMKSTFDVRVLLVRKDEASVDPE